MVFTLKRKLLSGFLTLDLLMAIIGGIAVYEFIATGRKIQATTEGVISEVEVAQRIVDEIGQVRYSGNRFLDVGSPDERKETLSHLDVLNKKLGEMLAANGRSVNQAALQGLQRLLATYREKFDAVTRRFEDRVVEQMDRLRDVEEIETALTGFFSQHRDSIEASRPFLFFMTAKFHLNTYFHTFDDQDFQELVSSLENVRKMLETSADHWEAAEAEQWRDTVKQVSIFITAKKVSY
jgi:hypothetical protein